MDKLYEYQKREQKKATILRELALDDKLNIEKTREIRKQQQESYDKYNFIKDLRKAIEKE